MPAHRLHRPSPLALALGLSIAVATLSPLSPLSPRAAERPNLPTAPTAPNLPESPTAPAAPAATASPSATANQSEPAAVATNAATATVSNSPAGTARESSTPAKRPSRRSSSRSSNPKDRVMIGAPITVGAGETVNDIVAIGSHVQVDGRVDGSLVSVLGRVELGPASRISRDLVVVGGRLQADPSADLGRSPVIISPEALLAITNAVPANLAVATREWVQYGLFKFRPLPLPHQSPSAWVVAGLSTVLLLMLGLLFPKTLRTTGTALEERPGLAFLTGLLAAFLSIPVLLLLLVTIVGSIAIPFILIAAGAFVILGKAAVYQHTGRLFTGGLADHRWGALLALLLGTATFFALYCIPVLGAVLWAMAGVLGFGATLLAALGRSQAPRPVPASPGGVNPPAASSGPEANADTASAAAARPMASPVTGPAALALPRVGFWWRTLATALDLILVLMLLGVTSISPRWFPFAWIGYHLVFWVWRGTTIGGLICRLRIVRVDGSNMSPAVAAVRLLGAMFSLAVAGLGFFWAGWSADKQSWHDQIAGTVIVRLPRSAPLL